MEQLLGLALVNLLVLVYVMVLAKGIKKRTDSDDVENTVYLTGKALQAQIDALEKKLTK